MDQSFWNASPKSTFFMGLFLGLAVSAVTALALVLAVVWNGKLITGPVPANTVAAANPSAVSDQAPIPAKPVKAVDEKIDHIRGPKNAKVTLIEYSDFECPYCKRHEPTVVQAMKEFPNDVRVVYRHYPLSFHSNAEPAAEASECAAKLGGNDGFWKMHDKLMAMQTMSVDAYVVAAKEIGLNEGAFKTCVNSGEMKNRISTDANSGNDAGVEGTPTTFVNGKAVGGAVPFETLKAAIVATGGKG